MKHEKGTSKMKADRLNRKIDKINRLRRALERGDTLTAKQMAKLRKALVNEAKEKPVRRFLQLDCDGPSRYAPMVCELRNTNFPVRVQIAEGVSKAQALNLLADLMVWLALDYDTVARWPTMHNPEDIPF